MIFETPAYISFSGGRTSGYLLRCAIEAFGGRLPEDVHVIFANTGREMPGTLDFVAEVARQWLVDIIWVEYALSSDDQPTYRVVDHATAARDGQPFSDYLAHVRRMTSARGADPYLPTPGNRYCTTELKIRVMKRFMLDRGYEHWTNVVGIRWDEPKRWRKIDRSCPKERWEIALPLVDERVTVEEVRAWWASQAFDLQLQGDWEGNCDACLLKMPWKVARVFADYPERATWWLEQERLAGKKFRPNGPSIADLVAMSRESVVQTSDELEIQCVGCTD